MLQKIFLQLKIKIIIKKEPLISKDSSPFIKRILTTDFFDYCESLINVDIATYFFT